MARAAIACGATAAEGSGMWDGCLKEGSFGMLFWKQGVRYCGGGGVRAAVACRATAAEGSGTWDGCLKKAAL